jgi:hypothetical protein
MSPSRRRRRSFIEGVPVAGDSDLLFVSGSAVSTMRAILGATAAAEKAIAV